MTEPEYPTSSERAIDRYRTYEAEDGSLVVYDDENEKAWVRSDTAVDLER